MIFKKGLLFLSILLFFLISVSSQEVCLKDECVICKLSPNLDVVIIHQLTYNPENLTLLGLKNDAISVNSYIFLGLSKLEDFIDRSDEEIRSRMESHKNKWTSENTTDIILMDIEGGAHPSKWKDFNDSILEEVALAYKKRVDIAREVWPNSRLIAYGFPTPYGSIKSPNDSHMVQSLNAYKKAGELGTFDNLDGIVPNIYPRWGPTDHRYKDIDNFTYSSIKIGSQIKKSDGSPIKVYPITTLLVYNTNSNHNGEVIDKDVILNQFNVINKFHVEESPIEEILIWTANGGSVNITEYFTSYEYCGDCIINKNETCDDGLGPNCINECTETYEIEQSKNESICGNNILEEGEECDDGNNKDGDSCSEICINVSLETNEDSEIKENETEDIEVLLSKKSEKNLNYEINEDSNQNNINESNLNKSIKNNSIKTKVLGITTKLIFYILITGIFILMILYYIYKKMKRKFNLTERIIISE